MTCSRKWSQQLSFESEIRLIFDILFKKLLANSDCGGRHFQLRTEGWGRTFDAANLGQRERNVSSGHKQKVQNSMVKRAELVITSLDAESNLGQGNSYDLPACMESVFIMEERSW